MNYTNWFVKMGRTSLGEEWCYFTLGLLLCLLSVGGNGYVILKLLKISRATKAIQMPLYLSLSVAGFVTGTVCIPHALYLFYNNRILYFAEHSADTGTEYEPYSNLTNYTSSPYPTTSPYTRTTSLTDPLTRINQHNLKPASSPRSEESTLEKAFCQLSGTTFNICSRIIIWLMLLLSVDRYIFICRPYQTHLVKKSHYVVWIMSSLVVMGLVSLSPFFTGHSYALQYKRAYTCTFGLNVYTQTLWLQIVLYVFLVLLLCCLPIFLNVITCLVVFFEACRMRKKKAMMQSTTPSSLGMTRATYVTPPRTDYELEAPQSCGLLYNAKCHFEQLKLRMKLKQKNKANYKENKASLTVLLLSVFHIVTYTVWVLIYVCSLVMLVDDERYVFLYHSKNNWFTYGVMSHHVQATWANAAFIPCLLGYSLARGKY